MVLCRSCVCKNCELVYSKKDWLLRGCFWEKPSSISISWEKGREIHQLDHLLKFYVFIIHRSKAVLSNLNKIALLQTTKLLTSIVEALYSLYKLFGEGKYSIYCLNISLDCLGTPRHMYTKPYRIYLIVNVSWETKNYFSAWKRSILFLMCLA